MRSDVGRIPVTERDLNAADVREDLEAGKRPTWEHDGGAFVVIGAEPYRGSHDGGRFAVWQLLVVPAPGNRGPRR